MSLNQDNFEGNESAPKQAEQIFLTYGSFLINVLKKDLPEQDAWDVFQNLYLTIALKGIPKKVDNVKAYLYRAAQNDIIDFKRRTDASRKTLKQYSQEEKPKSVEDPAHKLMQFDLIMTAFARIANVLNPSVNQVFIQKYQHNLDHHQIAEKLHIEKETVDRYLSIGTTQIQELYSQFMGELDE
ncbi:MAG: sigma-70 family RNA polymerase sigma factor [Bacteroidales bacterium]|nr:sigma-70 family RNA polymerase sigma factor [Bacteroidales bacterium]